MQVAAKEFKELDTVVLAISFRSVEFNAKLCTKEGLSFHVLSDLDRAVIRKYGVWNEKEDCAQRVTFLIDKDGWIRRIERKVRPETHAEDMIDLIRKWKSGRAIYSVYCARCHGDDGNETGYPDIKKLGGIGNRLTTPAQITKATAASGLVDLDAIGQKNLEALAIYVGGL